MELFVIAQAAFAGVVRAVARSSLPVYEEIASQLELSLATVKIRIFRARQKLETFR